MEIFIQLIFVMVLVNYCLKAALTGRLLIIVIYGVVAASIGFIIYPLVINQPANIVSMLLSERTFVTNGAIITTIEAVAGIFISVFLLDNYFMSREKRKKSIFIMKVTPGFLFIVALAYFELMFFKWRVGANFTQSAVLYCSIIFFLVVIVSTIIKYMLRGESIKLELNVLINLGILFIGLLINSSIADYNLSHADITIEWGALAVTLVAVVIMFLAGLYLPKINIKSLKK